MDLQTELSQKLSEDITYILEAAKVQKGDVFVLGCSSSEIAGGTIGKSSSPEIGQQVICIIRSLLEEKGIALAVQCCEHLNRALVVEKETARRLQLEEVTVVPALHAGGSCAVAAWQQMEHPVMVEQIVADCGIDIGDTSIGMHIRHVQVPVRPPHKEIGGAHVTALKSRPKYIGGPRAVYQE